ncbi:uncharacterized protein [Dermacentor albipictus]|uniref:uncharacterized protein n=1 Tax=Dermacentor albipictus TaxID=60249 RepID=UPI0038FCF39D
MIRRVTNRQRGLKEDDVLTLVQAFMTSHIVYVVPYLKLLKKYSYQLNVIRKATKMELDIPKHSSTDKLLGMVKHNIVEELIEAHLSNQRVLLNGQKNCSSLEVPVRGNAPQRDRFCKPSLTLPAKLQERRWCLCKPGYIRNAWEQCIEERECRNCLKRENMDFNQCSSACPVVCGKRVPTICTDQCVIGCACPPGYVRESLRSETCVPVSGCLPRCPRNSRFEICTSPCAPTCLDPRRSACKIQCHEGECVCLPRFSTGLVEGKQKCVPLNKSLRSAVEFVYATPLAAHVLR